ncbi:hypothetical protein CDAR_401281 [Caerostris darwini]|uniref:RNase H type-1 domain-containing protein n=1 Tax=Caerostris darwini TaxID=1538125 RepID=A0AAV4QP33_9ARAC|nr:hypothetical protein CDAR_401281 [Caerostris darwini]
MRRLVDHASIYQAELVAIHIALECFLTFTVTQSINIYSDTKYTCQSLADPSNAAELVLEVKRMYELTKASILVFFNWLKAHIGYLCNKLSDESAKETTRIEKVGWTKSNV